MSGKCGGCRDLGPHNYGPACDYRTTVDDLGGLAPEDDTPTVRAFVEKTVTLYECGCHDGVECAFHETVKQPEFTTLDSGERVEYRSGMQRDSNKGKPRFDLLMPEGVPYAEQMLTRLAALMARGADIRGDRNWEKADSLEDLARFRESAFRHFAQWMAGETDEDHFAATIFNMHGAEHVKRKLDT